MTFELVALIPLITASTFVGLLLAVRKGALRTPEARVFRLYLGVMTAWSLSSVTWYLSSRNGVVLQILTLLGTASPAVLLFFIQASYPTQWSRRTRRFACGHALLMAVSVWADNTFIRAVIDSDQTVSAWQIGLGWSAAASLTFSYGLMTAYLLGAHRSHRDPYERNRLNYMAAASILILVGNYTNLIPSLQQIPVDQALNAGAAALFSFTVIRYRLPNFQRIARRATIVAVTGAIGAIIYVITLAVLLPDGVSNYSYRAVIVSLASAMVIASVVTPAVRTAVERLHDRLPICERINHYDAVLEMTGRMTALVNVRELTEYVTQLCVRTMDSGYVAILLPNAEEKQFAPVQQSGPFPRPCGGWTIRTGNPLAEALANHESPVTPFAFSQLMTVSVAPHSDVAEFEPYRDCIMTPIHARGNLVGILMVGPRVYNGPYALEDMDFLTLAARSTAIALENAYLFEETQRQADTDFLTGLPNHRQLQDVFQRTLEHAAANGDTFCVAMTDVDNFKLLNDVHGHQAGDEALRRISATIRAALDPQDSVGRYGGDEFFIILPNQSKAQAEAKLSDLERMLKRMSFSIPDQANPIPVRISWGVAEYPADGATRRSLISLADAAMLNRRYTFRQQRRRSATNAEALTRRKPEKLRLASLLLDAIQTKDQYTREHSQQDAALSLVMADELQLSGSDRYALWLGALLHDIGKIATPAEILRKPSGLTPDEIAIMRQHVVLSDTIIRGLFDIEDAARVAACHHERWDGSGYPLGLKGEEIPRLARILNVVDSYSAMVHDRPYRKGLSREEALEEIAKNSGKQFDPEMVDAFIRAMRGQKAKRAA